MYFAAGHLASERIRPAGANASVLVRRYGGAMGTAPALMATGELVQILDLFAEDDQLNVYAGELEMRPPATHHQWPAADWRRAAEDGFPGWDTGRDLVPATDYRLGRSLWSVAIQRHHLRIMVDVRFRGRVE